VHKLTVIILSITILLQSFNFEVKDFNKIPTLLDHITCHFNTGDSFADFISMHYGSKVNMHKDVHKEHKELPFKQKHLETSFQYVYMIFLEGFSGSFKEIAFRKNNFAYNEPTSNLFINSIFQPPQK